MVEHEESAADALHPGRMEERASNTKGESRMDKSIVEEKKSLLIMGGESTKVS